MAELVHHLEAAEREREPHRALEREHVHEGIEEHVPLARHQIEPDQPDQQDRERDGAAEQARHIRVGRGQEAVRPHQRNAHEQIVVQQPFPDALAHALRLADQVGGHLRGAGAQQVVGAQEADHLLDVVGLDPQRGLAVDALHQRVGVRAVPARDDLEFRPAESIETIDGGIVQRPGRRPVERGGTARDADLLAQRRQHRGARRPRGARHHHPRNCRAAASGRRAR